MAQVDRVRAAEIMFGTGSKQHKAAIKRFGGKGGGPKAQVVTPKSTSKAKGSGVSRTIGIPRGSSGGGSSKGGTKGGGGGRGQRRDSHGRFA